MKRLSTRMLLLALIVVITVSLTACASFDQWKDDLGIFSDTIDEQKENLSTTEQGNSVEIPSSVQGIVLEVPSSEQENSMVIPSSEETAAPAFTLPLQNDDGALSTFMKNVSNAMVVNQKSDDLNVIATWYEYGGYGVFFDADDNSDVIWVSFVDEYFNTIEEDSPDASFAIIDMYALAENASVFAECMPFVIEANDPSLDYSMAQLIAEECISSSNFSNEHAAYYYYESEDYVHLLIASS